MNVASLQQEILKLKKEKDVCVLAHSYVAREICEIADFTGDSYKLSVDATKVSNKNILMCGVRFMAETCKILSPDKHVWLAQPFAGCEMADQMDREMISVNNIENKNILFIPDCNLGSFVAQQCPDKNIKLLSGCCPIHASVTAEDVKAAKEQYPNAELLVHPECKPEVCELADYIGSTSGIMDYAVKSDKKEFIIGTEISIAEHLQYMCPDKTFHILSLKLICPNMKATTLMDVYNCLSGKGGEEILLSDETIRDAGKCIDEMIRLGE